MSERSKIVVGITDLPDNERLIFKLILSVSERSRNRTNFYTLTDSLEAADILVTTGCSSASAHSSAICVQVVSQRPADTGIEFIQRPLIATRVLASLDRIIQQQDLLKRKAIQQEDMTESPGAAGTGADTEEKSTETDMLDFSISEEEASELAIVDDDTLSNPANLEGDEEFTGTAEGEEPSNVKSLPVAGVVNEITGQVDEGAESAQSVLVVDDSASVRKQLEIELDLFNAKVDFAEDAERAIDLLSKKSYVVVFLDVVLPDMDGFQICKKIKSDKEMKSSKVVMLTGKASHADKVRGSLAGCDAYLVKPVGRSTFQMAAKKYLTLVENVEVMEA